MCKLKDAIIDGDFPVSQSDLDYWYDEGQNKNSKEPLPAPLPRTSAWDKFIIWGIDSKFMGQTQTRIEREEEGRKWAKEQGLM